MPHSAHDSPWHKFGIRLAAFRNRWPLGLTVPPMLGGIVDGDRIPLGLADCHASARALSWYEREADVLALCAHCTATHAKALRAAGWERLRVDLDVLQNTAPV